MTGRDATRAQRLERHRRRRAGRCIRSNRSRADLLVAAAAQRAQTVAAAYKAEHGQHLDPEWVYHESIRYVGNAPEWWVAMAARSAEERDRLLREIAAEEADADYYRSVLAGEAALDDGMVAQFGHERAQRIAANELEQVELRLDLKRANLRRVREAMRELAEARRTLRVLAVLLRRLDPEARNPDADGDAPDRPPPDWHPFSSDLAANVAAMAPPVHLLSIIPQEAAA